MPLSRILRKGFITTFARGLSAAIQMVQGILVARWLGVDGSGQYRLALEFTVLTGTVAGLGIGQASIYLINNLRKPVDRVTTTLAWLALAWCPIYGALLTIVFKLLPDYFGALDTLALVCLPASSAVLIATNFIRPVLLAELRAVEYGAIDIVSVLVQLAATVGLILAGAFTVQSAMVTPLVANLAAMTYTTFTLRRYLKPAIGPVREIARGLFGYGLRLASAGIALNANVTAPSLLLGYLMMNQFEAVGLYKAAAGVCGLIALVGVASTPLLYSAWAGETSVTKRARQLEAVSRLFTLGGLTMACLLALAAPWVLRLLYSAAFVPAAPILAVMAFNTAVQLLNHALQNIFTAIGKATLNTVLFLVSLTVNVALNFLLIPGHAWNPVSGPLGSAVAMLISSLVFLVLVLHYAQRLCGVRPSACFLPRVQDFRMLAAAMRRPPPADGPRSDGVSGV